MRIFPTFLVPGEVGCANNLVRHKKGGCVKKMNDFLSLAVFVLKNVIIFAFV